MSTYKVEASSIVRAPAPLVYSIVADYRNGHPHILPKPYFVSLQVEQGGYGEGTIIRFEMRVMGKTLSFRAVVSEPEPGRVLVETNQEPGGAVSTFVLTPMEEGRHTEVKIITEGRTQRNGLLGRLEESMTRRYLLRVYARELAMLDALAREKSAGGTTA